MGEWNAEPSAPSGSAGVAGAGGDAAGGGRAEAWQQALAQLGGRPGSYNPEQVAELARRAGIHDPSQLAGLARSFGGASAPAGAGVPQHLLFAVGETICALPAEAVQSVERINEATPVPNTADWVLGVVQIWGAIVSIIDLQGFLGLPLQPPSPRRRVMVVTVGEMSVGLLVPAIVEMHGLGEQLSSRLDAGAAPEWLRLYALGAVQDGDRTVVLLDPARLLSSEKLQRYQGG